MGTQHRVYRALATILAMAGVAALGAASCGGAAGDGAGSVTVFAASSLTDAFGELASVFEDQHPGVEVRMSFGASSTLLAQIRHGAPADVYASADEAKMEAADNEGLVVGDPEVFVQNRLAILVPENNSAHVNDIRDLARPGVRLVLAQEGVPAAEYAEDILGKADARYRGEVTRKVLSNVVSREADVRAAVNRVALGDADATFAYASDVTPDVRNRVRVTRIPRDLNVVATYPIAVLKGTGSRELAGEWVDLVTSEEGQRVLERWGFEPVAR